MLVKSCIRSDIHASFLTRIRSYTKLFWFHIAYTGTDLDTGQDMTGFEDLITNSQISSLSQCNPQPVTATV